MSTSFAATPGAVIPPPPAGFHALLDRMIADPARHGRFVNTLSLMEYIGARKILKSQPAAGFTVELLAHVSEEIRHAHVLKRLALKLHPALETYAPGFLLAPAAASGYMQAVDRAAEADLALSGGGAQPWVNYLYTTLLVEERAGGFYPAYAERLAPLGHAGVIQGILREEENHLRQVVDHLLHDDPEGRARLNRLRAVETGAFEKWLAELQKAA
jgi:hypothetical protein